MVRLVPTGRGLPAVERLQRGGNPNAADDVPVSGACLCHICVNTMIVEREGVPFPVAYCKIVGQVVLDVKKCSDFKEEPPSSASSSSAAPSAT